MLTPVIVGEPLVVTAVQPTTVGVDVTVVSASEDAPVITLLVANTEVGSLPKSIVNDAEALALTVPDTPVAVLSLELTTAVTVSPTVKFVP